MANLLWQTTHRAETAPATYPWHTDIVSTTFWVGEVFNADAADGSQEVSTYDDDWPGNYGGCGGVHIEGGSEAEARCPANDHFPDAMRPKQNPFYLDLPHDDLNDTQGFERRKAVIPWAGDGCLGFSELNGEEDKVAWRFVDEKDVPRGPWTKLITRMADPESGRRARLVLRWPALCWSSGLPPWTRGRGRRRAQRWCS